MRLAGMNPYDSEPFSMALINQSSKISKLRYDLRGPLLQEAQKMERQGVEVLKLNLGNPAPFGFSAPKEILDHVASMLQHSQGYGDSKGLLAVREALTRHYQGRGVHNITPDEIFIGNGVSELIVQSLQALLEQDDEVLVPTPDYPLWSTAVSLSNGRAVHYRCDEQADWYPDLGDIRRKISARTRAIVIINPNNPTGAVYSQELLLEIIQLAREHHLTIFSDEIYDQILYDGVLHHTMATLADDVLILTFNGLSKAYFLAGFRQGWMVLSGPIKLAQSYIAGLELLASMRLGPNVPMQHAIQAALSIPQVVAPMIRPGGRLYEQSRLAWRLLNQIPGVSCVKPKGAIYLFPKLDKQHFNLHDDQLLALDLLRREKVLLIHGRGFNWSEPDHLRVVSLPPVEVLEKAINKLGNFLAYYRQ